MNITSIKTTTLIACLCVSVLSLTACNPRYERLGQGEQDIEASKPTAGELERAADQLLQKMITSSFLERYEQPAIMMVAQIENNTDIIIPEGIVLTRIREGLTQSGKVLFTTQLGREGRDDDAPEARALVLNSDEFDPATLPEYGKLAAPRLSLRTQMNWMTNSDGENRRQNTYRVRMFVTDVQTGLAVWESSSQPIRIVKSKPGLGF